jgi:hypothetical protein
MEVVLCRFQQKKRPPKKEKLLKCMIRVKKVAWRPLTCHLTKKTPELQLDMPPEKFIPKGDILVPAS